MTQNLTLLMRSVLVGRFYSLVCIVGLAIAIAAVILVGALIQHEFSYEKNFAATDRIYRLNWINSGTGDRFATMFNPFSPQLAANTDEIAYAARVGAFEVLLDRDEISSGRGTGNFERVGFVDPDFFRIFNFDFVSGDAVTALASPNSIVLTRAAAQKYFPEDNAVGQTITLENRAILTVTSVIDDMPSNTHFPFHFIAPLEIVRELYGGARWLDNWGSDSVYHYVMLKEGVDQTALDSRIMDFVDRNVPRESRGFQISTQRLQDIHFTPDLQNEMPLRDTIRNIIKSPRGKSDLVLFSAGALILVLIASFNFMNLQIARGFSCSKKVGLMKVVGASRYKIFEHILLESLLFAALSLVVALMIVEFSLGTFGQTIAVSLEWSDVMHPQVVLTFVAITLFLGLISGVYPAWLMASQQPDLILKGEFSYGHGAHRIREVLVLLQFTVSIILIAVSLGIYAQIRYSITAPLGFDEKRAAIISIGRSEVADVYDSLRVRILEHPDVVFVTRSTIIPTGDLSDGTSMYVDGGNPDDAVAVRRLTIDYDFLEALDIKILAGRGFHRDFAADEFTFPDAENPLTRSGVIVNAAAARRAGWPNPADAVGRVMRSEFAYGGINMVMLMTIVGVADDVHFRSLRSEVVPMVFFFSQLGNHMIVKLGADDRESVQAKIEQAWSDTVPGIPIDFAWLDELVENQYSQEKRILNLMAGVSIIAIGVACLGLFAVASLVTEFRRKEVALRKVFGATLTEVVNLLSWKFLKSIVIANVLAWPVAWLYLNSWLNNFVYRVDLSLWQFLVPGILTLVIAWITVASQAWTVARNSPIHALRYE